MSQSRGGPAGLGRGKMPLIGAAVVVVVVIVAVVFLLAGGGSSTGSSSTSGQVSPAPDGASGGLAAGNPTAVATIDLTRPTVVPTISADAPKPGAPGDKLVISKIGVDASLSYKTVGLDGIMPNPNGPDDVAVYDFNQYWPGHGGVPGFGGNIILAGHVDWGSQHGVGCKNNSKPPPCEAVLWDLGKLGVGDQIQIVAAGKTYTYQVSGNAPAPLSADWDKIVSATAKETVTLITCTGDFNPQTHEYDRRQVVTATRVT